MRDDLSRGLLPPAEVLQEEPAPATPVRDFLRWLVTPQTDPAAVACTRMAVTVLGAGAIIEAVAWWNLP